MMTKEQIKIRDEVRDLVKLVPLSEKMGGAVKWIG
jgi:hypothetical protein